MDSRHNRYLIDLKPGDKAEIIGFSKPHIGLHLLSMGLDIGTSVKIMRKTIGGNTFYIRSASKRYALRKTQAEFIEINVLHE